MSKGKWERVWYIVRKAGSDKILSLISALSEGHIVRKLDLSEKEKEFVIIEKAKRWHIAKIFSGVPVCRIYKKYACPNNTNKMYRNMSVIEGVEEEVGNLFYMKFEGDGEDVVEEHISIKVF